MTHRGKSNSGRSGVLLPVLLAALVAGLSLSELGAQGSPPSGQSGKPAGQESKDEAPAEPQAIRPGEIAPRAQQDTSRLRRILQGAEPDPDIPRVDDVVDKLEEQVAELDKDPRLQVLGRQSIRSLAELHQPWERVVRSLGDASAVVEKRVAELTGWAEELAEMRSTWRLTRESANRAELGAAVDDRIHSLLQELERVDAAVSERSSVVLGLQARLSTLHSEAAERIGSFDDAAKAAGRNLIRRDHPPLWVHLFQPNQIRKLDDQGIAAFERNRRQLAQFVAEYRSQIINHVAIYAGILLLVFYLRQVLRRWTGEKGVDVHAALHIVSRPFSTAFMLSALFTRLLYVGAPLVVFEVQGLLILLPTLRVLPGLVYRPLRRPLYVLLGLFAFDQIVVLTLDDTLLERDLLFVLAITAFSFLAWMLRPAGTVATCREGRGWRRGVLAARLTLVPLAISAVANTVGMVVLAMLLASSTLASARFAVVLFAIALVLRTMLAILVQLRSTQVLRMIRDHQREWIRRGNRLIDLAALLLWSYGTLAVFRVWPALWDGASAVLGHQWSIGALELSLGAILAFGVTLWIAVVFSRFLQFALQEDVLPRLDLPRGVPITISNVAHYLVLAAGALVAFAAAGLDLSKFALVAGALGVGIGFGLQNLVNNFVSGLILIFERPIQTGDTVEVGTLMGQVRRIGIRASVVRTYDGAEVIVPNGNLIASEVVNWTHSDFTRRIEIQVGVAYGTDPNRVVELLLETARSFPEVLEQPAPDALFRGFGDSSLNFSVRFWTGDFSNWVQIQSRATLAVHDALKKEGIEIPFPQRDLHLRSVDDAAGAALRGAGES